MPNVTMSTMCPPGERLASIDAGGRRVPFNITKPDAPSTAHFSSRKDQRAFSGQCVGCAPTTFGKDGA